MGSPRFSRALLLVTISSSPPLVTSHKAREKRGRPLGEDRSGARLRFDALRPQRLAAPVTVYVEQFSAHPLEHDAAELYGPPDGYVDRAGGFHRERQDESDVPVYEITLSPDDGLYPLPYMAVPANGRPWDDHQFRATHPRQRQLRRRHLDAGQPADRGDGVLAQSAHRHDAADLRQRFPAAARHDQQRWGQEPGGLDRIHRLARLG